MTRAESRGTPSSSSNPTVALLTEVSDALLFVGAVLEGRHPRPLDPRPTSRAVTCQQPINCPCGFACNVTCQSSFSTGLSRAKASKATAPGG